MGDRIYRGCSIVTDGGAADRAGDVTGLTGMDYRAYPFIAITSRRNDYDYLRTPTYDLDRAWCPVQIHSKSCLMAAERH